MESLDHLRDEFLDLIKAAASPDALEQVRVAVLGKKGRVTELLKGLGGLAPEARREHGAALNRLRDEVEGALGDAGQRLNDAALVARLAAERIDVTLPAAPPADGRLHPISQTIDELIAIFGEMGLAVAEGPHIEDDFYNFTALNIPPEHPARQEQDTFYLPERADGSRKVLRTHTSPVQVRTMLAEKPPIRIIVPGRTFRSDHDATHSPMFHQVEGLVIDRATHMGHLKGCLIEFCRAFFDIDDLPVRFRPSYFPFTEPSAEVDIGCSRDGGGLKIGAGADWLEPVHVLQGLLGSLVSSAATSVSASSLVRPEVKEPIHWFDPGVLIAMEDAVVISAIDEVYPELRLAERISADRLAIRRIRPEVMEPPHFRDLLGMKERDVLSQVRDILGKQR